MLFSTFMKFQSCKGKSSLHWHNHVKTEKVHLIKFDDLRCTVDRSYLIKVSLWRNSYIYCRKVHFWYFNMSPVLSHVRRQQRQLKVPHVTEPGSGDFCCSKLCNVNFSGWQSSPRFNLPLPTTVCCYCCFTTTLSCQDTHQLTRLLVYS